MTSSEFMLGLKPVTVDCFSVFAPYYEQRAKHYIYPSYMQSVCYMLSKGNFYWKIFNTPNGTVLLVISRSRMFGIFGVQVNVCPISSVGSASDEILILKECLKQGLSVKMTTEDIRRYHIPQRLYGLIDLADEYIYHSQKAAAMSGSKYRKLRNQTKRITSNPDYRVVYGATEQAADIIRAWDERYKRINGTPTHQAVLWNVCKSAPEAFVSTRSIFIGEQIECVSVLERLSESHYVIVLRVRNYDSALNDVGSAMQWVDCSALSSEGATLPIYANIGMADTEGLKHAKQALIPCAKQKIYNRNFFQLYILYIIKPSFRL